MDEMTMHERAAQQEWPEDDGICGACLQRFADLSEVFSHDCPGVQVRHPVPVATHRSDSVDAPERHEGRQHRRQGEPATPKQVAFLVKLGATEAEAAQLTKSAASRRIDELLAERESAGQSANPASEKQLAFLEKLLQERPSQREAVPHPERLSKPEASQLIDALLQRPKEAASQPRPNGQPDVPAGHYAVESSGHNDLAFYRVDRPERGQWAGRTFVKLVVGGHPDQNVPRSHVAGVLQRIAADPDAAARYGRELGRCSTCNRHLTDETSRALGIGPECRSRA